MFHRSVHVVPALAALLLTLCLPNSSAAQDDTPVLAPRKPIAPKVESSAAFAKDKKEQRSMVGGPWMLDPNMKSTLYLRNSMETESIVATPVLYLSNGKRIDLPAVTLNPASTASVRIGDALLDQGIAPYANLKGYVEISYMSSYDPLCATVVSVDTVHSVIFTYSFRPTAPAAITLNATGRPIPDNNASVDQQIDGVWWKQRATVTGFVSLSNTTAKNIQAQLQVTGANGAQIGTYPVSLTPHDTEVVDLKEFASSSESAGGVELTYHAPPESILVSGGMEDTTTGYSATMAFRPSSGSAQDATPSTTTLTELGLMTGTQDLMMLFPAGTQFTPFSVIRNVSVAPVSVTPEAFWMDQGSMHRQKLPALTLQASQTIMLDMPSLLKQAGLSDYNGMLNLTFNTTASPNALLLASGSVDQTGTYVFQVLAHQVRESMAKSISYWSTGNGDDTMVTIWNPADEAQDFLFTLRYEGGSYVMPLHLDARATHFFNIASIIQDQIPDVYGHVIPTTVTSGSARLSGPNADNEYILADFDAGSYNVRKATCWYYCISCDGGVNSLIGEPVNFSQGTQHQLSFLIHQNTGYDYDYSQSGTWSSNATSVATIATGGRANGVSVGNFTASSYISQIPIYSSNYCAYNAYCPDEGYMSGSGGGTVNNYNLKITAVSPITFGGSGALTVTGTGFSHFSSNPTIAISGVQIANAAVVSGSDTTITATYTSTCSATVGSNAVTVTFTTSDGGTPQGFGTGSIVLPSVPAPTIMFGGNQISGTLSVVAGQQIALTSGPTPTLPNCIYFYNTTTGASTYTPLWSAPTGTAIGGYSPTPSSYSSATVTPITSVNTTASSYTFYWIAPGTSLHSTLKYYYAGGGAGAYSPSATANFNVTGPTLSSVMTSVIYPTLTIDAFSTPCVTTTGPYLVLGNISFGPGPTCVISGTRGITFGGNISGGSGGQAVLVQLINDGGTSGSLSCTFTPGLDLAYPYPYTNDSPASLLKPSYTTFSRTEDFTTYLLWQTTNTSITSIPVPLGYQKWGFSGSATCSGSCGSATSWTATTNSAGLQGGFVHATLTAPNFGYPTWSVPGGGCN